MKTNYLFPAVFRKIGWMLLVPFGVLSIYSLFYLGGISFFPDYLADSSRESSVSIFQELTIAGDDGILDEVSIVGLTIALLLVSFSREKDEDEYIAKLRMESLVWAILLNYMLVILATLFIYDIAYLYVAFISMFTVLILFIIKYNWVLYHFRKTVTSDE